MDDEFGLYPELTSAVASGVHAGTGRLMADLRQLHLLDETSGDAHVEHLAVWLASCFGACFPYWRFAQQNYLTHLGPEEHAKAIAGAVAALMTHLGGGVVSPPDPVSGPEAEVTSSFVTLVLRSFVHLVEQLGKGSEHSDHALLHESFGNLKDAWLGVIRAASHGSQDQAPSEEEEAVASASLKSFIDTYVAYANRESQPATPDIREAEAAPSRAWGLGRRIRNALRAFKAQP